MLFVYPPPGIDVPLDPYQARSRFASSPDAEKVLMGFADFMIEKEGGDPPTLRAKAAQARRLAEWTNDKAARAAFEAYAAELETAAEDSML